MQPLSNNISNMRRITCRKKAMLWLGCIAGVLITKCQQKHLLLAVSSPEEMTVCLHQNNNHSTVDIIAIMRTS